MSVEIEGTAERTAYPTRRLLYWSLRRELWESRSIVGAPLVVAALVLLGSAAALLLRANALSTGDAAAFGSFLRPLRMAPAPIMLASLLVGLFYALDALHGERRDRSLLFWKSLPVSDRVTVLAKIGVPVVVLPLVALGLSYAVVAVLTLVGSAALWVQGASAAALWSPERLFEAPLIMAYGLAAHALWFAPIYAWLLLVSAWARRLPLLWATLPWIALVAVELAIGNGRPVARLLGSRVTGAMQAAFRGGAEQGDVDRLQQLDPIRFLATPGLWLGLAFATLCVALAVRLRHRREPD